MMMVYRHGQVFGKKFEMFAVTVDLDRKFGLVLTASVNGVVSCAPEELTSVPESLTKLDEVTAGQLKILMSKELATFGPVSLVYAQTPILWVVDENGDVWIALEEIVTRHSRRYLRPRVRGLNPAVGETRLGHPALVRGRGRIGGELLYDQGWGALRSGWKLTNSSGRFGMNPGRTADQLENVRQKFISFDISVDAVFLGTRKDA